MAMALAALANLMISLPSLGSGGFPGAHVAWSLWIVSLLLLGNGFLWTGIAHPFTPLGLAVAAAYLLNGALLALMIWGGMQPFVHPEALIMGRLVALFLFCLAEWKTLPKSLNLFLATTTFLQILKVAWRIQFQPREITTSLVLMETGLLLLMATAIFLLGLCVKKRECARVYAQPADNPVTMSDFNNPEHPWNKDSDIE